MPDEAVKPFESIESALEFMVLLESSIAEAAGELRDMQAEGGDERRGEAINLALYKMHQLSLLVQKSRRLLNDLGLLRSMMLAAERPEQLPEDE